MQTERMRDASCIWAMKLSIDKSSGDVAVLKALKAYVAKLNADYSKKAFRYFVDANMMVLSED